MTETLYPLRTFASVSSEYQSLAFVFQQLLANVMTAAVVQVKSVTNDGGLSPVGYVSVQPMLNQLNGAQQPTPHGIIGNIPYFRIQGGTNAVIIDPNVGDIGILVFSYRDISSLVAANQQSPGSLNGAQPLNPATLAQYDWGSGLYIGGFLNGIPVQYVQFNSNGIAVVSPTEITLQAPTVKISASTAVDITGPVNANGAEISTQGEITDALGVVLGTHVHSGVSSGTSDTGKPVT